MYESINNYLNTLLRDSAPDAPVWNIESIRQGKKPHWNYIDGCMITALIQLSLITKDVRYSRFAEDFISYYIDDNGNILGYDPEKFNLDDINEGRVLFYLYEKTGNEKYKKAMDILHHQLLDQPRTETGNFWHKKIYPDQIWLDGIYMAQVFSALYEEKCLKGDCSDIVKQIENVEKLMRDPATGLYFHGCDVSKKAFWADPATGCSKSFWLRSMGWFMIALADLSEILDEASAKTTGRILKDLIESIAKYADPETSMYYQVPDKGERQGNYLETSGSAMVAYAMLKAARLGIAEEKYAVLGQKTFDGICKKYLKETENGLTLSGICLVAGLGPEDNKRRDGTFEYYISEPVVENDAKGVAPFILCYTEILRRFK